jgi:hypothetical protein
MLTQRIYTTSMLSNRNVILFPSRVHDNETLTVQSVSGFFRETAYTITNEAGKIIRKGAIASNLNEFKLRIVGLQAGVYRFVMGSDQENFVVE